MTKVQETQILIELHKIQQDKDQISYMLNGGNYTHTMIRSEIRALADHANILLTFANNNFA